MKWKSKGELNVYLFSLLNLIILIIANKKSYYRIKLILIYLNILENN